MSVFLANLFSKLRNRPSPLFSHLMITRKSHISWASWWVLHSVLLLICDPGRKMPFCILRLVSSALRAPRKKSLFPHSSQKFWNFVSPASNWPVSIAEPTTEDKQYSGHIPHQLYPNHKDSECRIASFSRKIRILLPTRGRWKGNKRCLLKSEIGSLA